MSEDNRKLNMILHKRSDGHFELYGCVGAGKGCKRNYTRNKGVKCDDCVLADENETIEQLYNRMTRGSA